jgi:tetratricopeptide (TPR) repeat protein
MVILCAICKDEEPVIRRFLASAAPYIDGWVIGDTGSTDGTKSVIHDAVTCPGHLIDVPWTGNFSEARNAVRNAARTLYGDLTYHLWGDCDEEFLGHLPATLEHDSYAATVTLDDGTTFLRTCFARPWIEWEYPIHEILGGPGVPMQLGIRSHTDGARARKGDYEEDLEILHGCVETPRVLYYLGQTYRMIGDFEEARKYYRKRVQVGDSSFERRHAALWVAYLTYKLNQNPVPDLLKACQIGHPGAWLSFGAWLNDHDLPQVAEAILSHGKALPRLLGEHAQPRAWEWEDELSQSLGRNGHRELSSAMMWHLLTSPDLPASEKSRIEKNLEILNGPSNP